MSRLTRQTVARSPLALTTIGGLSLGALLGIANVLFLPTIDREQELGQVPSREQRNVTPVPVVVPVTSSTPKENDQQGIRSASWFPLIAGKLEVGDLLEAISIASRVDDNRQLALALDCVGQSLQFRWLTFEPDRKTFEQQREALERQAIHLQEGSGKKPGYTFNNYEPPSAQQHAQAKQEYETRKNEFDSRVEEFRETADTVISRAVESTKKLADTREKVLALARFSWLQRIILDNKEGEARILAMAQESFEKSQAAEKREKAWKRAKYNWSIVIGWISTLGVGGFALAVFGQVFSYYLVRHVASLAGDEDLAKHLGTTIRTVRKTALILPEQYRSKREERS